QEEVPALARAAVGRVREEVPEPAARAAQPDGPEVLVADRRREPLERRTDVGIVAPVPGQERLAQRTVPDQQALDREDGGGDVPSQPSSRSTHSPNRLTRPYARLAVRSATTSRSSGSR